MIDLRPDTEQQAMADSIAAFLKDKLPLERHGPQDRIAHRHEFEIWRELADLGCFALCMPEAHDGLGLGLAEDALVFREYGRHLLSPSMLATTVAVQLAQAAGLDSQAGQLMQGSLRAALAIRVPAEGDGAADAQAQYQLFAARPGDLVLAWSEEGLALHAHAAFSGMQEVRCTDESVTLHTATLAGGAARLGWEATGSPLALAALVRVSAMLVGISEAARDMAVGYAQTRMQFGQLIGGFQAIKHRCADMALRSEAAWSQTVYAALSVNKGAADSAFQAATAKLVATRAALEGAADNIQTHGGMGFTAEIPAHLLLKRSHLLNQVGGNVRFQQGLLLTLPAPG